MTLRRDPDRRHPLHDALCAFVIDDAVATQLLESLFNTSDTTTITRQRVKDINVDLWRRLLTTPEIVGAEWPGADYRLQNWGTHWRFTGVRGGWAIGEEDRARLEQPVVAARGRIAGYVDVYLSAERTRRYQGRMERVSYDRVVEVHENGEWFEGVWVACAVEVKARITSFGDVIRQIQKYREEWPRGEDVEPPHPDRWVVLSPSMTEGLRVLLKGQNIIGIKPSDRFPAWCREHGLALPADARRMLEAGEQPGLL